MPRLIFTLAAVALLGCAVLSFAAPLASTILAGWLTAVVYGLARLAS